MNCSSVVGARRWTKKYRGGDQSALAPTCAYETTKLQSVGVVGICQRDVMHMGLDHEALRRRRRKRAGTEEKALARDYLDVIALPALKTFLSGSLAGTSQPTVWAAWRAAHQCRRRLEQMAHGTVAMVVVVETDEQKQRTNVHMLSAGIVGSRRASMVLPEPGGPTMSRLWSWRPHPSSTLNAAPMGVRGGSSRRGFYEQPLRDSRWNSGSRCAGLPLPPRRAPTVPPALTTPDPSPRYHSRIRRV